jgi:hypothetical protein
VELRQERGREVCHQIAEGVDMDDFTVDARGCFQMGGPVKRGQRVERVDPAGRGRNAARNGMAALLRRELYARGRWPIVDRPREDPS